MKKCFGEILQYVLDQHDMTQKNAAEVLHLTPQTLNSYIKNRRTPDLFTFQHIVQIFHLDANLVLEATVNSTIGYKEYVLVNLYQKLDNQSQLYVDALLQILSTK